MRHVKSSKTKWVAVVVGVMIAVGLLLILLSFLWKGKSNPTASSDSVSTTEAAALVSTTTAAATDITETTTVPSQTTQVKKAGGPYDYSQPVPESELVEDSYFDDSVFIGNSRTEGFSLYAGLSKPTFYTHMGLMVNTVFTEKCINVNGKKVAVMDALRSNPRFSKVYIMLGMNELGWAYSNLYVDRYTQIIEEIKKINPQAKIYVQSILPVSKEKSDKDSYINKSRIDEYNALIRTMTEQQKVYYVDVGSALADGQGYLPDGASYDGVHLKVDYCKKWLAYLKCHIVK